MLKKDIFVSLDHTEINDKFYLFAQVLKSKKEDIKKVLIKYESNAVINDEIHRSVECLENIKDLNRYFNGSIQKVCTFFPLNLPLYSLILFGIVPSVNSNEVIIRAPLAMRDLFDELVEVIGLQQYFPNITISKLNRTDFVKKVASNCDVIIFTGTLENAQTVKKACPNNKLFIFNGAGHNPLVISNDCDIELAVQKAIEVKTFNNGQDCAGPDEIFIHSSIKDTFISKLIEKLNVLKIGRYNDDDEVVIGPVTDYNALLEVANFLINNRENIIYGGGIDFKNGIVTPTIILTKIKEKVNFNEIFSPIFFITEYEQDEELSIYLNNVEYKKHEMYISLFGSSAFVESQITSTIIRDKIIHDVEKGNNEFGGLGKGASFVQIGKRIIPKPTLIPREIDMFLIKEVHLSISMYEPKFDQNIEFEFRKKAIEVFGNNLAFAFIFGSYAKGIARANSDIDMLVCVKEKNQTQEETFTTWYFELHNRLGRIPDCDYPVEILTTENLSNMSKALPKLKLDLYKNDSIVFDYTTWAQIISDQKVAVVDTQYTLKNLSQEYSSYPEKWKNEYVNLIKSFFREEPIISDIQKTLGNSLVLNELSDLYCTNSNQILSYLEMLSQQDFIFFSKKVIPFTKEPVLQNISSQTKPMIKKQSDISGYLRLSKIVDQKHYFHNMQEAQVVKQENFKHMFIFRLGELSRKYGGKSKEEYSAKELEFFINNCEFYDYLYKNNSVGFALIFRGDIQELSTNSIQSVSNTNTIHIIFDGINHNCIPKKFANPFTEKLIFNLLDKFEALNVITLVSQHDCRLNRYLDLAFEPCDSNLFESNSAKTNKKIVVNQNYQLP